jgi:hypothetical protein
MPCAKQLCTGAESICSAVWGSCPDVATMIQFQVYLRGELGKLSDRSQADWFLRSVSNEVLKECGLPIVVPELIEALGSQTKVDTFVLSRSADQLTSLTKTCDHDWRHNYVYAKLAKARTWHEADISIESIDVQQAESSLAFLFKRNDFQLSRLVVDPELEQHDPYKASGVGRFVEFRICTALLIHGRYRLFDGIHRAIQMARNGEHTLHIVYAAK